MKKIILYLITCFIVNFGFSQAPVNDDCSAAIDLGTLPAASPCNNGVGGTPTGSITQNGTNISATAVNPYVSMTGCNTGNDMANPAADVWYSFTSTASTVEIAVTSSLVSVNVGLWSGNCGNLQTEGCAVGNANLPFVFKR